MSHDNISTIIRISFEQEKVSFGKITKTIDDYSGDHVGVTVIEQTKNGSTRDLTVKTEDEDHRDQIISRLRNQSVNVIDITDKTFQIHKDGKIEVRSKYDVENHEDLSQVYTPDVARVSKAIDSDPSEASNYTIKQNTIAIVTDGSALLGIGNVKPEAALPVMEGKAMLFKQMAGVNAYPICLETQDTEEIITTVKNIAPSFGGINMEDIAGPKCFEIEQRLEEELDIPVFHDDQHGTAVVLMAGFLNALKLVNKELEDCKVVLTGIGAAGLACSKMLLHAGVENLIGVDTEGALVEGEHYENDRWQWMAEHTNPNREGGELSDVIKDADVFIGVSAPNILGENDVKKMTDDAIVFAMA
ncbi:MAG TPA: malic enzyme-like NAD(P)-binding protein, partial [Bacillales bacterium]|nr:malic enzyme-like NAD(P)-binding protein [Bacillales bacterium]